MLHHETRLLYPVLYLNLYPNRVLWVHVFIVHNFSYIVMWWWCYARYLFYKIGFKMCPTLCPTMCPNGAHGAHVLLCPTFHIFNKYMKYKASYLTLYSCGWSCRSYNKILDLPHFVPHFVPHYVPQWGTWGTCLLYPTFHIFNKYMKYKVSYLTLYSCGYSK